MAGLSRIEVVLYRESTGEVPLLSWLGSIPVRARDACLVRLQLLEEYGRELRRPHADFLRDGIYELRARRDGVNYRMLYFFCGRQVVVVSHGVIKQRATVPPREIERAIARMISFRRHAEVHSFRGGI